MVDDTSTRHDVATSKLIDARGERAVRVRRALESVTDPEIPVVTVLDMGMIGAVRLTDEAVDVDFLPTFAGCPALDVIQNDIRDALLKAGERQVRVRAVFHPPWTTERITAEGRRKLKAFGLAPPGPRRSEDAGELVPLTLGGRSVDSAGDPVSCPYCDSRNTRLESAFGPTLCRAIHYCDDCRQSFEQFKVV